MTNLTAYSASLTVAENALATDIGILAPTDDTFPSSTLTVTVTALPSDGIILLADGVTPVTLGETLSVQQLTGLRFRPTPNSFDISSSFTFTVSDPAGNTASAAATLTIGSSSTPVVTTWARLSVPVNSPAIPIGISAPVAANYSSSQLTVTVTALPADGIVLLSDGTTPVTLGQRLTVDQLTGLKFAASATDAVSILTYSVSDPAGHSATGSAMLAVSPATPPVTAPTLLTIAANSGSTAIGIRSPTDASFVSTALNARVMALPTNGTVMLSDGSTPVTLGETLTIGQLTGLQFKPTPGVSAQSSSFTYNVTDPTGSTTAGNATLIVGPNNTPLVTTPQSLTVVANSAATPIGIVAPNDTNFAASALSVTVTQLPTDGAVLLSDGTTPVTMGESLTVAQLTGLLFEPKQGNTGQSSSFSYSVSDPAGNIATGTATVAIGTNAIVLENQKPGTPKDVWQIDPGDDSTKIQGFTTAISTNVGGTTDFKITNQTGNSNYHIDIYRLGYYGGDGATLVTTIQHKAANSIVQPAPLVDQATGLVDAGNWQVTDSWAIPTNATSGVYVANVIDGSEVFQIPFVVRNDASHSDIVFQTADQTWQAYNLWGGANLYEGNGPAPSGAAYEVSYNRPITTRDTGSAQTDMLFGAEYSAI